LIHNLPAILCRHTMLVVLSTKTDLSTNKSVIDCA
jgi:hypothetical protein